MTQFGIEIRARVAAAQRSLEAAQETGDHYLVSVLSGELDSLRRIATDHAISLDDEASAKEPAA